MRGRLVKVMRPVAVAVASMGLALVDPTPLASQQPVTRPAAEDPVLLRAEAFEAAQWSSFTAAAGAIQQIAARFALGPDRIGALERAQRERQQLLGRLNEPQSAQRRAEVLAEIAAAEREIAQTAPAYAELTRPSTLSVAETQALLDPNEALLFILTLPDASYVFAVTRDDIAWSRSEAFAQEPLADAVAQLRSQLIAELQSGQPGFDDELAHRLYTELVQPVETILRGRTEMMVVTNGPIAGLPLHLLVTEPEADNDRRWLIDRYALSTLPAVSSLKALRCLMPPSNRRHRGCPAGLPERSGDRRRTALDLAAFGAPVLTPSSTPLPQSLSPVSTEAGPTAMRPRLADPAELHALGGLPGAEAEISSVARMFDRGRTLSVTGAAATETAVKQSDRLNSARFVLFATHGLMAREASALGVSEPGLVFTPPAPDGATDLDDGLLTTSEAATLRLSADLVVLSACNTAASGSIYGGEQLSGLARSFFYAGANAILASHWVASDAATARLMTGLFSRLERGSRGGRAQALRQAMRDVRRNPAWASPAYWGAFVLVGTTD